MTSPTLLFGILTMAVVSAAGVNESHKTFSCSELPLKIPVQCLQYDFEISRNSTSLVIGNKCEVHTSTPFDFENGSIILSECVNQFEMKIIYHQSINGKDEEKIHYRCEPCDSPQQLTANPTTAEEQTNKSLIIGLPVGISILLVVIGIIIIIIIIYHEKITTAFCKNKSSRRVEGSSCRYNSVVVALNNPHAEALLEVSVAQV